jgi:hypothetical protein
VIPRRLVLVLSAPLAVAGFLRLRQPILTWGATQAEAAGPLAGDELLPLADGSSTRAIDIDAPPDDVWPWLAQMGPAPRGGAYTYDWIENLLGLDMHSVDHVLPEFQHPQVGDTIGLGSNRMRLELVEPRRALAWRSQDGNSVWTFVLEDRGGATRLISRNRYCLSSLAARIGMLPMEAGSLVMERRMLREIKRLFEGLARQAHDRGGDRNGFWPLNHVVNPLVRRLLRSPLHPVLSGRLALITVIGRQTGRRFTIPVGYQREAGVVTVEVGAPHRKRWWRNLRGGARVTVRLAGRDYIGWATMRGDERSGVSVEIVLDDASGKI